MKEKTLNKEKYYIFSLSNGTVIDHIPSMKGPQVLDILGVEENDSIVVLGMNLRSTKLGRKDVVKIEGKYLSEEKVSKIAIVAPTATISLIKDNTLLKKYKVEIAKEISGLIACLNPNCITVREKIKSLFFYNEKTRKVSCNYCEKEYELSEIKVMK
ncbi:MAG: aspartate carbamoyltransferase regulatory subunit [Candidatus Woesearchaeota archaeon]